MLSKASPSWPARAVALPALLLLGDSFRIAHASIDPAVVDAAVSCNQEFGPLVFALLKDEAVKAAIEDDIRFDLAKMGFEVERRILSKDELNLARNTGNFHFTITETWGAPYDPSSFASGWIGGSGGEGVYPSMANFDGDASREELLEMVEEVLKLEDPNALRREWAKIHNYYHQQAMMLPLYGKRIPTLLNRRLTGFQPGYQQFDYPVHRLRPVSGSNTVTIAPGAQTGLFKTVGTMNAHVYRPNEFFANNWVYEGLVAYGDNGDIEPTLAKSWVIEPNDLGGDDYIFTLREGVTFHDGADWNCEVAKMNLDHIFAGNLQENFHSWYGVGRITDSTYCNAGGQFVMRTNVKHGPYLQELTAIRPTRMKSPNAFVKHPSSNSTDPFAANSCHLDWGIVDGTNVLEEVNCAGIQSIAGTGPFRFVEKESVEGIDTRVIFEANQDYWGGAPAIERLEIVYYATAGEVKEALLSGELDIVWGSGVLSDADIVEIQNDPILSERIQVGHSQDLQNVILLLNTRKPPLDDINVRKIIIHSINKAAIVEKELSGLQEVVDNVFPRHAPYCDIDLTPRWDYDFEKAVLLSCGSNARAEASTFVMGKGNGDNQNRALALGLGLGLGLLSLISGAATVWVLQKNKELTEELKLTRQEKGVTT